MKFSLAAREAEFHTRVRFHLVPRTGPGRGGQRVLCPQTEDRAPQGTRRETEAAGEVGSSLGQVGGVRRECGHDPKGEKSPENENIRFGGRRVVI